MLLGLCDFRRRAPDLPAIPVKKFADLGGTSREEDEPIWTDKEVMPERALRSLFWRAPDPNRGKVCANASQVASDENEIRHRGMGADQEIRQRGRFRPA